MSICTKTGDSGTTGLMYNRRVPKTHPRIEACGTIDELNAAIGVARAGLGADALGERLLSIQRQLVTVMGELAVLPEDLARYEADGFARVGQPMIAPIEEWIREVESQNVSFRGWATPGATPTSAAFDLARTICRRAERRVQHLVELQEVQNPVILIYLNRLSDCLWLWARARETAAEKPGNTAAA